MYKNHFVHAHLGKLVERKTSCKEALQHFQMELVTVLPMDIMFLASASAREILSSTQKAIINGMPTKAIKASHFLDYVIEPSMVNGNNRYFIILLDLMEKHELDFVGILAKTIRSKIDTEELLIQTADTGQFSVVSCYITIMYY